jgi:hypothetical protein
VRSFEGVKYVMVVGDDSSDLELAIVDWLRLPVASHDTGCPRCGGKHFGAINSSAALLVYSCHGDDDRPPCGCLYRGDEGYYSREHAIEKVVGTRAASVIA